MQIEYIGKREKLKVTFTRLPYTFRPGEVTDVDDPDDQQTLLAHPTSFVRVMVPEPSVVDGTFIGSTEGVDHPPPSKPKKAPKGG